MILIFDLFETLIDDISLDFNRGLKTFWERHYRERCSFEEIKTYGEELFVHMQEQHKKGLEFAFVKDELPYYAEKFGGEVIPMDARTEAEFLMRCNEVNVPDDAIVVAAVKVMFWEETKAMFESKNIKCVFHRKL